MDCSDIAVVLAAHGSSKDVRINGPMFDLSAAIAGIGNFGAVTPAFLDGQPSVKWVLDEIEQETVVVIPFMTSCGYYSEVVFPKHLQSERKRILFADPIGTNRNLAELVTTYVTQTMSIELETESTSIIVVGHGTRRNKNSCRTTIDLAKSIRTKLPNPSIRFAFIDQRPYIDHVFAKTKEQNIVVVPFLMGYGPHTTCDVPQAFGGPDLTSTILDGSAEFPMRWNVDQNSESKPKNIFMTKPVGTYQGWAGICADLAIAQLDKEVAA